MEEIEIRRFDWFFDKHFGIGMRWDNFYYPIHLSFSILFITINIGIGKSRDKLLSITEQLCRCLECDWNGTVWDCEPDVDGDGSLGCPECLAVVKLFA